MDGETLWVEWICDSCGTKGKSYPPAEYELPQNWKFASKGPSQWNNSEKAVLCEGCIEVESQKKSTESITTLEKLLANVEELSHQESDPGHDGCTDVAWDYALDLADRLIKAVEVLHDASVYEKGWHDKACDLLDAFEGHTFRTQKNPNEQS